MRELLEAQQDPLQQDGKQVLLEEMLWRKRKQRSLAEAGSKRPRRGLEEARLGLEQG